MSSPELPKRKKTRLLEPLHVSIREKNMTNKDIDLLLEIGNNSDHGEVAHSLSQLSIDNEQFDDQIENHRFDENFEGDSESSENTDGAISFGQQDNGIDDKFEDDTPEILKQKLLDAVAKVALLDGKFFKVDLDKSSLKGNILAICQSCQPGKEVKGSLRTTSNFNTHLKKMHRDVYDEYQLYLKTRRGTPIIPRHTKHSSCKFDQEDFEENVTDYVLDNMLPLNTVEKPSFRKIFDALRIKKGDVPLKHLSRYFLQKKIDKKHITQMAEIRDRMSSVVEAGGFICTTADVWTGGGRRFLGMTASWINAKTLTRESAAIACKRFMGTHSFDAIASNLAEIHAGIGLSPEHIRATVTDNGSNFVKAFREFGIDALSAESFEDISEPMEEIADYNVDDPNENRLYNEPVIETEFYTASEKVLPQHLRCTSHTLNLVATTDIHRAIESSGLLKKKHSQVMKKCNSLWKLLRSPKLNEALRLYFGISLKRPVVTRWNSSYDCIRQLLGLKTKILNDTSNILKKPFVDSDFDFLQEYVDCTTELAKVIDRVQRDDCHYGILFPSLVSLRLKMIKISKTVSLLWCQPVVEAIVQSLETRFSNFFELKKEGKDAGIAAISHPSFKSYWIGSFSASNQKKIYDSFIESVIAENNDMNIHCTPPDHGDEYEFGDTAAIIPEFETSVDRAQIEVQVTTYLRCATTTLDVLNNFPLIRKVFLKYNTPLPSSAPVERLFSYTTMLNVPKFNKLTDAHFEKRILAKANSSNKKSL